jgi:uncharacterized membrane protein YgdD (TMEM256/DUF423 family)
MAKLFLCLSALSGFLAVGLGAFGAHGLKGRLSMEMMAVYQTAVQYHFYHTFALALVGLLCLQLNHSLLRVSAWGFLVGLLLFSGSLYLLSLTGIRWLGAITPFGGFAFLLGWLTLAIGVWRSV